jgi:hypothetical protein
MSRPSTETAEKSGPPLDHHPAVCLFAPWRGLGVACDSFGLPRDKYEVHGGGRLDEDGATIIDWTVAFENGHTNVHAWKFASDTGEEVIATDLLTGVEARGRVTPQGFYWVTCARMKTPLGMRMCRVELSYTILSADEARTSVTIDFLGVTVATANAHISKLGRS